MDTLTPWRNQFAPEVVGHAPRIIDALNVVRCVAETPCGVMIRGETGTGKELFARATHRSSGRRGAFIPVNCASIPEQLLETELFGHVKGAFSGAVAPRAGRFVSAQGGTIFLDEIGDLPLAAQAKLLRVLEERVVSPVGSDTDIPVDVRVVAATHRDLDQMIADGEFRADLYYRLTVVPIDLPALRHRGDDIDELATICMRRSRDRLGKAIEDLDASALAALHAYSWPGNVRELAHKIERAVLLNRRGRLAAGDFSLPKGTPAVLDAVAPPDEPIVVSESFQLRGALEQLERDMIERALARAGGNRTEAAALLGLNRTTLVEKLRKLV